MEGANVKTLTIDIDNERKITKLFFVAMSLKYQKRVPF